MTTRMKKTALRAGIIGALTLAPFGVATATASADGHDWDAVANCESSGNWATNTRRSSRCRCWLPSCRCSRSWRRHPSRVRLRRLSLIHI